MEDHKTDRDLLVETNVDVRWLKQMWEAHLVHHRHLLYSAVAVVGAFVSAIVLLLIQSS